MIGTGWTTGTGRGFDWEISAPYARRVLATAIAELAVADKAAEMIGAVARHGGGLYECQRLVAECLECVLKVERCEPPQPGGCWVTELFEVGGALAPRNDKTCRMIHGLTS
jgi:hypothetical protein